MKWSLAVLCLCSMIARADIIDLGTLSYDTFIPSSGGFVGIDAFDISNLTGVFNLPPDFPVLDNLVFQSATLTLSDGEMFALGDIAPGFLLDGNGNPVVQVPANVAYQSAELTATLSATTFAVPAGTFTASSNALDVLLLPSQGPNLTADVDATLITASGQLTTPEPAGWSLLLIPVAWLVWKIRTRPFNPPLRKGRL
jgi:hypothetical protein